MSDLWVGPALAAGCPDCDGPRLHNLVYQHRTGCELAVRDDQTQAADWERDPDALANVGRPATVTELELLISLGWNPGDHEVRCLVDSGPPGIYRRRFVTRTEQFDPDHQGDSDD